MKLNILLFLTLVLFGCSSSSNEAIKNADELINQKKYLSAYKYLETADPKNSDVNIVLKKIELLQNYFVQSLNHKRFALKDLENDEDLFKIRSGSGQFVLLPELNIPKILDSIKNKQPSNYMIHLALASYYGEYENRFGYKDEERNYFINQIKLYNNEAYDNGYKNYRQCYEIGVEMLNDSLYEKGIERLKESIDLNYLDDNYFLFNHAFYKSEANYNIGYAYLRMSKNDSAQKYFTNALLYCKNASFISAINYNLGQIAESNKNLTKAVEYFKTAILFDSNSVFSYINILWCKEGHSDYDSLLSTFFSRNKDYSEFLKALNEYYINKGKTLELINFYSQQLSITKKDSHSIIANLNYSTSELYYSIKDFNKARYHLIIAKENFLKFKKNDDYLFEEINSVLKDLSSK